jgi:uncharacterized phage protein (TIGR02218 family)
MKTLPSGMILGEATTLCHLWRITRNDGVVLNFTDHDEDLTLTGDYAGTYAASSGFAAGSLETKTGMAASSLEIAGGVSSAYITDADILANKYDNAFVQLMLCDWLDTTKTIILMSGNIGDIKKDGIAYTVEILSLAQRLNNMVGRVYARTCDAKFCDSRCGLNAAAYTEVGSISAIISDHKIACTTSAITGKVTDWFTRGMLTFTSGFYAGEMFDIKQHDLSGGIAYFTFWNKLVSIPTVGSTFSVLAGCKQTLLVCKNKFNNVINFQGFPSIPGNNVLTSTPIPGSSSNDGQSMVAPYE